MKKFYLGLGCFVAATLAGTTAHGEDLSFLLSNESDIGVVAFHVSDSGTNSWEENLIEGGVLDPGYEIDVIIADGLITCRYDIRTEFENGESFEDYDLDLCEMNAYIFE